MDTTNLIVILLLMLVLICFVLFYYLTQQSLRDISLRLTAMQPQVVQTPRRSQDTIRRERAFCQDKLAVLEASLSVNPRDSLTPEEVAAIDKIRKTVNTCIDELKSSGEWMGVPFDFEWNEILDRLPKVNLLYRSALAAAQAAIAASDPFAANPTEPDKKPDVAPRRR
jgi:hypothetical protein